MQADFQGRDSSVVLLSLFTLKSIHHSHVTVYTKNWKKKKKEEKTEKLKIDLILQFLFIDKITSCIKGSFMRTRFKGNVQCQLPGEIKVHRNALSVLFS